MVFVFLGAVGKSAQLGLHVWLPDAMEGPTPVSALIHAATMVTAGVFVLTRCAPFLESTPFVKNFIIILGAITAFFAASVGLVQNDIKRIIAFSTCSQLGYMVFACGLSGYSIGFFHLINHAFFKALLFLSAGTVIHSISDEQDIRKMGGLLKPLNFVYVMFVIGSLALMGFPFLTGFYSKDTLLEYTFSTFTSVSLFSYWLGLITALFTAFYSLRLILFVFFFESSSNRRIVENLHNISIFVYIPLFFLSLGSIFFGYIFKDLIMGYGTSFWDGFFQYYAFSVNCIFEYLPFYVKLLPLVFSFVGIFLSILVFYFFPSIYSRKLNLITFLSKKWGFDNIYQRYITSKILYFGYEYTLRIIDRGFFELLGPLGCVRLFYQISFFMKNLQTSFLFHYVLIFFLNFSIFLILSFFVYFYIDLFILFFFLSFYSLLFLSLDGCTA